MVTTHFRGPIELLDNAPPTADGEVITLKYVGSTSSVAPFTKAASGGFASPYIQTSTVRGINGDTVDMNMELGFRGFDQAGDAALNNAAWSRLIQDAAAYTAATGGIRTYKVEQSQVWRMSSLNNNIPKCRLMLGDTLLVYEGSPSRNYIMFFSGGSTIDALRLTTRGSNAFYRGLRIGSPTDTEPTYVGRIKVDSENQQINRPGNGNRFDAALSLFCGKLKVDYVDVRKQDFAILLNANSTSIDDVVIGDVYIESFKVGMNVDNCTNLLVGSLRYNGSSPSATPDPGQNALIIQSTQHAEFPLVAGRGSGEHAVRLGGPQASTTPTANITFGDIIALQPGQTAFKVWNADLANPVKGLTINSIYAEDCGSYRPIPAYNDYVANIQNAEDVNIGRICGTSRVTSYSAYDGVQISGVTNMQVGEIIINNAVRNSLFVTNYINSPQQDPKNNSNITVSKLTSSSPGAAAVAVEEASGFTTQNVEISTKAVGGTNYVAWSGTGAGAVGHVLVNYNGVGASGAATTGVPAVAAVKTKDTWA